MLKALPSPEFIITSDRQKPTTNMLKFDNIEWIFEDCWPLSDMALVRQRAYYMWLCKLSAQMEVSPCSHWLLYTAIIPIMNR